eukprot:ANDGO_08167.mRNA.1 hypothetical protein
MFPHVSPRSHPQQYASSKRRSVSFSGADEEDAVQFPPILTTSKSQPAVVGGGGHARGNVYSVHDSKQQTRPRSTSQSAVADNSSRNWRSRLAELMAPYPDENHSLHLPSRSQGPYDFDGGSLLPPQMYSPAHPSQLHPMYAPLPPPAPSSYSHLSFPLQMMQGYPMQPQHAPYPMVMSMSPMYPPLPHHPPPPHPHHHYLPFPSISMHPQAHAEQVAEIDPRKRAGNSNNSLYYGDGDRGLSRGTAGKELLQDRIKIVLNGAAADIQRIWRGYACRKALRSASTARQTVTALVPSAPPKSSSVSPRRYMQQVYTRQSQSRELVPVPKAANGSGMKPSPKNHHHYEETMYDRCSALADRLIASVVDELLKPMFLDVIALRFKLDFHVQKVQAMSMLGDEEKGKAVGNGRWNGPPLDSSVGRLFDRVSVRAAGPVLRPLDAPHLWLQHSVASTKEHYARMEKAQSFFFTQSPKVLGWTERDWLFWILYADQIMEPIVRGILASAVEAAVDESIDEYYRAATSREIANTIIDCMVVAPTLSRVGPEALVETVQEDAVVDAVLSLWISHVAQEELARSRKTLEIMKRIALPMALSALQSST